MSAYSSMTMTISGSASSSGCCSPSFAVLESNDGSNNGLPLFLARKSFSLKASTFRTLNLAKSV